VQEIGEPKALFNPKTVALIGASEKEGSVGRAVLENLMLFKEGNPDLHPVVSLW
jgi:acyl-CoA synthetase (NDP forming)